MNFDKDYQINNSKIEKNKKNKINTDINRFNLDVIDE